MEIELNEQEHRLLEHLMVIPPNLDGAEKLLSEACLSADAVTRIGLRYLEGCFSDTCEGEGYPPDLFRNGIIPGRHSTHLYEVTELLLRFGLNPNAICDNEMCMLSELRFVDNEYVGADTMALLLEHGADPNLVIGGPTIFEDIDFDVCFDTVNQSIRHRFDALTHCWMTLLGYGGMYRKPDVPYWLYREFESDETFDLKKLRDHRNYYVGLSIENGERMIHIYDRRTFWEVARF